MRLFLQAWLVGWLFWTGLAFGALANRLLQGLTGGEWTRPVRTPCEAAAMTLPLMALLFVPIAVGAGLIYPWTDRALFADHDWPHKEAYLTVPFFSLRSALTLGACAVLAGMAVRGRRETLTGAAGLIVFFLCMMVASTDWVLSLTPQFRSSIFPAIFMANNFLAALAFVIIVVCAFPGNPPPTTKQCHDLGNLLLAFVAFSTYVSVSQLLLVWSANLPDEISWYLARWSGGWEWFALALVLLKFAIPFALLLSRTAKRNPRSLAAIAAVVLAASALEIFWFVEPSLGPGPMARLWLVPLAFTLVGAAWLAAFRWLLPRVPQWRPEKEAAYD